MSDQAPYSGGVQSLLERDGELAAMDELLERGGALVVEGRAGIGKTALLDATRQRATGLGHEVLDAGGSELEAGFAFGVVRQLFERRLASADQSERAALLAGPARSGRCCSASSPRPRRSIHRSRCCTGSTG